MTTNSNQYREEQEPREGAGEALRFSVEAGEQLQSVIDGLRKVHEAVLHDQDVATEDLEALQDKIGSLEVDIQGYRVPLGEMHDDPELKKNVEIWKEIEGGNFDRIEELTLLTEKIVKAFELPYTSLHLDSLTTLDAKTAQALAEYDWISLQLNGFTTLDAKTAQALAQFKGKNLYFNGLTTLNAQTAQALAEFKGEGLYFCGLTSLDAKTAQALAKFKGQALFLIGLTTLDAKTAQALAELEGGTLHLEGLTSLSDDAAKALARCRGSLSPPREKMITKKILSYKTSTS